MALQLADHVSLAELPHMTFINGVQFMRIIKYGQLNLHQRINKCWKTVKKIVFDYRYR